MTSSAPKAARDALDQAVKAYAEAIDEHADSEGAFIPTGWVICICGIRSSFDGDGGTSYITESMPGLPYHASTGLWVRGLDSHHFGFESRQVGDE